MASSNLFLRLIIVIGYVVSSAFSQLTLVKSEQLGGRLTNMLFHKGRLYVGGEDTLRILNADLSLNFSRNTCASPDCRNFNKVLLLDEENDQLITSGTGENGTFQLRRLSDLVITMKSSVIPGDEKYLRISSAYETPVQAILTMLNKLMIAVTYGEGIETNSKPKYIAISTRELSNQFAIEDFSSKGRSLSIELTELELKDYLIDYRGSFQSNWLSYFVTNQKNVVGDSSYVSKVVRICQNDTGYSSYTDIKLQCIDGSTVYNLIQNVALLEVPGTQQKLVVGTFSKGTMSQQSPHSVVCAIKLDDIDSKVMEAKKLYAMSCDLEKPDERYILRSKNEENQCINITNETDFEEEFRCDMRWYPLYTNVIGKTTAVMKSSMSIPVDQGSVTLLYSTTIDDKPVVIAGTSNGSFIMMNFHPMNFSLTVYSRTEVHPRMNITAIHKVTDDIFYILTLKKVYLLKNTNCSKYLSCAETMSRRDPLCGWCVYEQRSTRRNECNQNAESGHWLSSLDECVSISVSPQVLPIKIQGTLTLTVKDTPKKVSGDYYQCKYSVTGKYNNATELDDGKFQCQAPYIENHIKTRLEFFVIHNGQKIMLAETEFPFYDCETYKSCGECVNTVPSTCIWCISSTSCSWSNITCQAVQKVKEKTSCPALSDSRGSYFAQGGENFSIKLPMLNINEDMQLECYVQTIGATDAMINFFLNEVECIFEFPKPKNSSKKIYNIKVEYKNTDVELDDDFDNYVTVYDCGLLAEECGWCYALNTTRYNCKWCNNMCRYNVTCDPDCPEPVVTSVYPADGPPAGGTLITIQGKEFGSKEDDIQTIKLGNYTCSKIVDQLDQFTFHTLGDFENEVPKTVVCKTGRGDEYGVPLPVIVKVNGKTSDGTKMFTYKKVTVFGIRPQKGPKSGGTVITIDGEHLDIGSGKWSVWLGPSECTQVKVKTTVVIQNGVSQKSTIECVTGTFRNPTNVTQLVLSMDLEFLNKKLEPGFQVLQDPEISDISGQSGGFISGGTRLTVVGRQMENANVGAVKYDCDGEMIVDKCKIKSNTRTECLVPVLCEKLRNELMNKIKGPNTLRRKRDTCSGCLEVEIVVKLDGVEEIFVIRYFRDPSLNKFDKEHLLYKTDQQRLVLSGENLNLVATKNDFNVTIGIAECTVIELTADSLTCSPPKDQPASLDTQNKFPEVNVQVGNIDVSVGYLEYEQKVELIAIIAGAVAGGLLFIIVIGFVIGCYKYRKVGRKAREYEKNLSNMEMEIKRVAREEFLDMHTTMSSVNKNLVEQGFPYHDYQQFACNVMFSVDYLWTEPVVSNGKMTDDERLKANKGMKSLEELISNKFFLVSVITTMEREKRFFIREKSNLAGNLCAVLMGKMDYLNEILKLLMTNLVQESSPKKHKTLFRRCESITEKLLSNWVSLCLYPHIKKHSGSALYLLYIATQKTLESGPIDAVTGDAKYTLSEEKLLKKWSSQEDTEDLKFEAKTLTLNLVVDNGEEIFKCKVLDCDTILQVKNKCLSQIYVNFPASKLPVGANDLVLEWHEGFGGVLKLRDEDNTSKRDGHWVRLNTLAHYNVKDDSNMALIDPHSAEIQQQEDYVNLAQVNLEGICDGSMDSTEPLAPLTHNTEDPHEIEYWHLVKKEEESSKQGKSAIAELYLNRLFTTKQSIMEYTRPLFDIILDQDRCPPPTKFLFDFLDELGESNKVDGDTIHAWKSHSYAIRVWASLMKMPNLLFDVSIPTHMNDNLDIISQVFIESFSLTSQKFTKDSPSQKLIFHHEMNHYREKVKEFYKNVKVDSQNQEEFRQQMSEVNRLQQQTSFNKISALYRFYKQLKPYFEDILENLSTNKEASDLHLDRKLEQVIAIMEEEED